MRLQTWAILVFSACLVGWFLGYPTPLMKIQTATSIISNPSAFLSLVMSNIVTVTAAGALIGLVIGLSIFTGFSAVFVIPLMMLLVLVALNFLLFPVGLFLDPACAIAGSTACTATSFSLPVWSFLNLITILMMVEFIRGPS